MAHSMKMLGDMNEQLDDLVNTQLIDPVPLDMIGSDSDS
jgi:hypothetical protein